jgi:hypothetical protein
MGDVGASPETRPPGQRGHGFADGIGGPDDSTPLIPDIQINTKVFFSRIKGPILKTFLAISALSLIVAVLKLVVNVALGLIGVGPAVYQITGGLFNILLLLVGMLVGVFQVALYVPARNAMMMNTPEAPTSIGEAISQAKPALGKAFLLVFITSTVIAVGSGCCGIPGIIAFFLLWPARYLVIARGMDISSGINASMDVGKKYWLLILLMMVAIFVMVLGTSIILGIIGAINGAIAVALISAQLPLTAIVIVSAILGFGVDLISWVLGALLGVGMWSVEGGIMTTLEAEEYGELVAP